MVPTTRVVCPYCFETIEIVLDPESRGEMVRDCEVCCHPWRLVVRWEGDEPRVQVDRLE